MAGTQEKHGVAVRVAMRVSLEQVKGSWEAGILETSQYIPCPVNFFPTLLRLQD